MIAISLYGIECGSRLAEDVFKEEHLKQFPCHKNLTIETNQVWEDGFKGTLKLPVLQDMSKDVLENDPLFKYGHVNLTFNKNVRVSNIKEENHGARKEEDNKKFSIFTKLDINPIELAEKKVGDVWDLGFTIHHDLEENSGNLKGKVGITEIQFGNYICPEPIRAEADQTATDWCYHYIQPVDKTQPDGLRADISIPIEKIKMSAEDLKSNWTMDLAFPKNIKLQTLHFPDANVSPDLNQKPNANMFLAEKSNPNDPIKDGKFTTEVNYRFNRDKYEKKNVKIVYIKLGNFQCGKKPN